MTVENNDEEDITIHDDFGGEDYGNEDPFEDVVEDAVRNNYKEKQAKPFCAWRTAMPKIVEAYICFLGSSPSGSSPCTCPSTERKTRRLNLFSWDGIPKKKKLQNSNLNQPFLSSCSRRPSI
ncbi:unnamed protein product [Rhizopus stolonifer]